MDQVNSRLSNISFSTTSFAPAFPPGLAFKKASFSLEEQPKTSVFDADRLVVTPGIRAILFGKTFFSFDALAYGGEISGWLGFEKNNETADITLSLKKIRLQDHAGLPHLQLGDIEGILNAQINYRGPRRRIITGEGEGNIQISKGKIKLKTPFMGLEILPFGNLTTRLTLKKQTLRLDRVELDGEAFQGSLSGTVQLSRDIRRSRLNLKGELEPFENYLKSIDGGPALLVFFRTGKKGLKRSFVIQGTFMAPKFRFI